MRRATTWAIAIVATLVIAAVIFLSRHADVVRVEDILAIYQEGAEYEGITITYPVDGTLFPPEMVPPTVRWSDNDAPCSTWLVRVELGGQSPPIGALIHAPQWTPTPPQWETIKKLSIEHDARIVVLGIRNASPAAIHSGARITLRTSTDSIDAPLFYREVNLVFNGSTKAGCGNVL